MCNIICADVTARLAEMGGKEDRDENVTVLCSLSEGLSGVDVSYSWSFFDWTGEGRVLDGVSVDSSTGNLIILQFLSSRHIGIYRCQVTLLTSGDILISNNVTILPGMCDNKDGDSGQLLLLSS